MAVRRGHVAHRALRACGRYVDCGKIGLVLGFGLAFTLAALARATIANTLYGVGALEPLTYVSVLALVIAASTLALLLPARRAARVDPMVALRAE